MKKVCKIEIARLLDKDRSTIGRELNNKDNWDYKRVPWFRGRKHVIKMYCAEKAQANYERNKQNCGAKFAYAKDPKILQEIEKRFFASGKSPKTRYSPDQIIGQMKDEGLQVFDIRTMYNYVRTDITKIQPCDLLHMVSRRRNRKAICKINKRILGESIENRPGYINNRSEFGHWEGDSIIDGLRNGMLVKYERLSRLVVIRKLPKHNSDEVERIEAELKKKYFELSSTYDNGSEFWQRSKNTNAYFTHPSSPYEKGGVENVNGIIRRHIPKGKNFTDLTNADIQQIENHINNMPRKILGYKTANQVYQELLAA